MTLNDFITGLGTLIGIPILMLFIFGSVFFVMNTVFPFFSDLSPEKRLQKYVDQQCVSGNKVAIKIRRDKSFYSTTDATLIRAAIDGNEFAIQALKLDEEKKYGF